MKKISLFSVVSSIFFIFFFLALVNSVVRAQADSIFEADPDSVGKILCTIFNCDEGASGEVYPTPTTQPTPDPHATPRLFPTPTGPQPTNSPQCNAPGGQYICGSRSTPLVNCSHCGAGYPADEQINNCDGGKAELWGTAYAIDIKRSPLDPVLLPHMNGHSIEWLQYKESVKKKNSIVRYEGTDYIVRKKYILQFHHSQIGSGIGIGNKANSGTVGARICPTCDHVHIQIAESDWVDATRFYCK